MTSMRIPSPEDVLDARFALSGIAVETPVIRSQSLDSLTGGGGTDTLSYVHATSAVTVD